jgi:murein L,D-transpeptidase YafK
MKKTLLLGGSLLVAVGLLYPLADLVLRGPALPEGVRVSRIIVVKSEKRLYLAAGGQRLKSYRVALGWAQGAKQRQGDRRTPEGVYEGCRLKPGSTFYKAIYVTYPNAQDRARGRTGGAIEIHGLPRVAGGLEKFISPWIVRWGWTQGCVMVTNPDMAEIARVAAGPLTVEIRP